MLLIIDLVSLPPVPVVPQNIRYVNSTVYFSEMNRWEVGSVGE